MSSKRRYNSSCLNCGGYDHEHKNCVHPITSWGIILVKRFDNSKLIYHTANFSNNREYNDEFGVRLYNKETFTVSSINMMYMNFLLVQRMHSLGFAEFIRGKYSCDNVNAIMSLFNQMTNIEIEMIRTKTFDELWFKFWGGDNLETCINDKKKDYNNSHDKYNLLCSCENGINYYVTNARPIYSEPEWGFPKGRKKRGENDLDCAKREFFEETGLCEKDISILHWISPIVENLIGTNGISYRHIYYLAECNMDVQPCINNNCVDTKEIGKVDFFNYTDAVCLIRDYHHEKIKILGKILSYYNQVIMNTVKEKNDEHDIHSCEIINE